MQVHSINLSDLTNLLQRYEISWWNICDSLAESFGDSMKYNTGLYYCEDLHLVSWLIRLG